MRTILLAGTPDECAQYVRDHQLSPAETVYAEAVDVVFGRYDQWIKVGTWWTQPYNLVCAFDDRALAAEVDARPRSQESTG